MFSLYSFQASLELPQPRSRQVNVALRRPLRFLLEGVKDMNRVSQRGDVNQPEGAARVSYSDLANAGANARHRLPIARIATPLNLVQLVSALATRIGWKVTQPIERVAMKGDRFKGHPALISIRI
jgi:hypothetical protein